VSTHWNVRHRAFKRLAWLGRIPCRFREDTSATHELQAATAYGWDS
jgi:hypothetical protein